MKALTIVLGSIVTVCLLLWLGIFYQENFCLLPKPCTVLSFGQRLSFPNHDYMETMVDGVDFFVFRRSPKDPAEILVTAQSTLDSDINKTTYAEQKYKFNLYQGGPPRRISEQLWASGMAIQEIDLKTLPMQLRNIDQRGLVIGFAQSGWSNTGAAPVLSLNRKQVALPSHMGFYIASILSQLPDHGLWYWDIYDMETQTKQMTIRGLFLGIDVSDAQGSATWLPDSRLVLTVGERRTGFILCDTSGFSR